MDVVELTLGIYSGLAVILVNMTGRRAKFWCCILGLVSSSYFVFEMFDNENWPMCVMFILMVVGWAIGYIRYWFQGQSLS